VSKSVAIGFMRPVQTNTGVNIVASDEEVKEENLDEKVPCLLIFNVKKETAMQNIITEENKEEAKTLQDKPRPADITKFSMYNSEREVLFAPLSSFKIDNLPQKVKYS
jgi:hypothetical protein